MHPRTVSSKEYMMYLLNLFFLHNYYNADVVLDFEMTSLSGPEGDLVEVCVVITDFPTGGVEIPVTLELGTKDGPKAGSSACTFYRINISLLRHYSVSMWEYKHPSLRVYTRTPKPFLAYI